MHVAVTGAAGFIGRALLSKLAGQHQNLAPALRAADGDEAVEYVTSGGRASSAFASSHVRALQRTSPTYTQR